MPSSVFSSLFSTFDARTIGELASHFGQPAQSVSAGLESSTACLLAGLANKASDSDWTNHLFKLVSEVPSTVNVGDLTSAVTDPSRASSTISALLSSGKNFLSLAFGGNQSSVVDAIGKSTGLRSGVVSTLMNMAAPLMMTSLGRLVREDRMNPEGFSRFLIREGEGVRDLLPAGALSLLNAASPSAPVVTPNTRPVALGTIPEPARPSPGWRWLIPLLLLPLLLYWGYRASHRVVPSVQLNRFVIWKLPDNVLLNIPQNGVEARLLAFIKDPSRSVEPATWFDFDRLLFNTDSATLRPESREQLRNIAEILKAFPNARIKIGGYTDNSGDVQHNLDLSQARAEGVMSELIALGISPDRLEAQGYGDQFPVADNSTEEGRAKNRRVSMRVTQK